MDPRVEASPTASKYVAANIDLYSALSGDFEPENEPDWKPEKDARIYYSFNRNQLNFTKDTKGNPATIRYISDPWGSPYGYSTAANEMEAKYRKDVKKNPTAKRPADLEGFNPTFDLWSTAGATTLTQKSKWVRNWSE